MKTLLLASLLYFLWVFFHRKGTLLSYLALNLGNSFLDFALCIARGLLYGYIVYAFIAVYGSFARISSPSDIALILTSRPSAVGGPGILGVLFGALIAFK